MTRVMRTSITRKLTRTRERFCCLSFCTFQNFTKWKLYHRKKKHLQRLKSTLNEHQGIIQHFFWSVLKCFWEPYESEIRQKISGPLICEVWKEHNRNFFSSMIDLAKTSQVWNTLNVFLFLTLLFWINSYRFIVF